MLTFAILYSWDTAKRKGAVWGFFSDSKVRRVPQGPKWLTWSGSWVSVSWSPWPSHLLFSSLLQADASHNRRSSGFLIPFLIQAGSSRPLQSPSLQWLNRQPTSYLATLNPSQAQNKSFCCYWRGAVILHLDSIHRIYSQLFHQFCLLLQ